MLMQASTQWTTRPADERFTSLNELLDEVSHKREISTAKVLSNRAFHAAPVEDDPSRKQLVIVGPDDSPAQPTHWSFGQVAARVQAPAGYLRSLPSDIVADALNYGFYKRDVEEVGVLLRQNGGPAELSAMTGPNYGRIWNEDVVSQLIDRFGDGVTGQFTVPGHYGMALDSVTKENTTIFGSDRDMFVFLADEQNKIEVPNRRNGQSGFMSRGFFIWNSEVGAKTFGIATFLFDYVCQNRIVWGPQEFQEFTIRHTSGAPDRFLEEAAPAIESYAEQSTTNILTAIQNAKDARLEPEKLDAFLAKRFSKNQATAIKLAHKIEEERPIESLWDVTVGATAYARKIEHQDARVDIERKAGQIMELAS